MLPGQMLSGPPFPPKQWLSLRGGQVLIMRKGRGVTLTSNSRAGLYQGHQNHWGSPGSRAPAAGPGCCASIAGRRAASQDSRVWCLYHPEQRPGTEQILQPKEQISLSTNSVWLSPSLQGSVALCKVGMRNHSNTQGRFTGANTFEHTL